MPSLSRREVLRYATASTIVACAPRLARSAPPTPKAASTMLTRTIPRTKEAIPAIGLGTWQAFDVEPTARVRLAECVEHFLAAGGRVIDSSPMYGRAELVVGDVLGDLNAIGTPF